MRRVFDTDYAYSHVFKMIKDLDDLRKTKSVWLEFQPQLKEQWLRLIADDKTYPAITLEDFQDTCQFDWAIMDDDLTPADIERAFRATKGEDNKEEDVLTKPINRYELFEMLIRMAKIKYLDKRKA